MIIFTLKSMVNPNILDGTWRVTWENGGKCVRKMILLPHVSIEAGVASFEWNGGYVQTGELDQDEELISHVGYEINWITTIQNIQGSSGPGLPLELDLY